MRTRDRSRRWPALAAAGIVVTALGLGSVGSTAGAQDAPSGSDLAAQFGGFELSGRSNGLQLTYNVENVFPIPAPLFQASVPEATATMTSGPSSFALGSVAYPGSLLANLPGVVGQSNPEFAAFVPPYPLRTSAAYPSGPPDATQQIATAQAAVTATDSRSTAVTTMSGADLPQFVRIGSITTSAQSALVAGAVESRSRIELAGVDLLFGLLHFDSIVTDLVATSDGSEAASAGGTTVTGLRVLGIEATLGPDGIILQQQSQAPVTGPLTPIAENLPDLGPVTDLLGQVFDPLNGVIGDLLESGTATVNDLLAAAGIRIQVLEPFEVIDGSSAERTANGIVVDITYDGSGDNPLAQLLALIPTELLPADSPPEIPLNVSPQALVNLLKETHVTGFAIGYGNVSVQATEAFTFTPVTRAPAATRSGGATNPGTTGVAARPGFSTPSPALPGGATPSVATPETPTSSSGPAAAAGAGALVALALLSSPLWALGSRQLADNVLGVAGTSCPDGLDRPLDPGRS